MILEINLLDMAFDVSKYPFYNIEKWTIWWQTEVDVSNIFKSLLCFMIYMEGDIVHENEFLEFVCIVGTMCDIVCNDSFMTNCNHQS
jgi:hypothetical protein